MEDPDSKGRVTMFVTVMIQFPLGVCAAVLVQRLQRARTLSAGRFFAPYAMPSHCNRVCVGAPPEGARRMGSSEPVSGPARHGMDGIVDGVCMPTAGQHVAFYSFVFVTVLARLVRLPDNLYRAAEMLGAGSGGILECHATEYSQRFDCRCDIAPCFHVHEVRLSLANGR